jgi:hypothetical protein
MTRARTLAGRLLASGALGCVALLLALPAGASAHTIKGLVHDARDVVIRQVPGTHARISSDGVHLVLTRDGASVVEVLDLQGLPALKLDARGGWARKGAPIVTVLSIETGAPDPRNASWLRVGDGTSLRFHYPGTHGEVIHHWSVPLRVDGRTARIEGAVERVARPPLAWAVAAGAALVAGAVAMLLLPARRRIAWALVVALALAAIAIAHGESAATSARPWGVLVAALVALAGLCLAYRLRRDAALEQGALAVTAILLVLPLIGRLAVLRHGVVVTTLPADAERALVIAGLAAAAGTIGAAARAWWPDPVG